MSILSRYTIREVLGQILGVFSIVLTIFMVQRLGALLQEAAEGSVGLWITLKLLGLRTLMAVPSLLPVAMYAAILLGISRLSLALELTAMAACGVSPARLHRSVLIFAAGVAVMTGLLAFSVRPWAAKRFDALRSEAAAGLELGSLIPGRFYEISATDDYVVFAETRPPEKRGYLQQVFVQQRHGSEISILTSEFGIEYRDEAQGYRFLRLIDGNRYDFREGRHNYDTTQFGELTIRAPLSPMAAADPHEESMPSLALWQSDLPKLRAEFQWRMAQPMAVFVLALFAIPLARVDPRHGRSARVFVAILLYVAYRNLLGMSRNWVEEGTLNSFPGIWAVHGCALAIAIPLLIRDSRR